MGKKVAVLAVQGAFIEHERALSKLGCECMELRQGPDVRQPFDALVLPGGESTVQAKLLRELGMIDELHRRIADGIPVMGTCAGLILLAKTVEEGVPTAGDPTAEVVGGAVAPGAFGTLPVTVRRNAYGRQLGSFHAKAPFSGIEGDVPMTFIRAPYVKSVGAGVEILSETDGRITAARWRNQLVTAFHPELTKEAAVHQYFLAIISEGMKS